MPAPRTSGKQTKVRFGQVTRLSKAKSAAAAAPTRTGTDDATMLHVRIPNELKAKAATTLEGIGFTTSEAVRLFLHRVVVEQRLPLDLKVPNAETQAAIVEAREMAKRPGRFKTPEEMFDALEKAG